jgi:hypothetical protein
MKQYTIYSLLFTATLLLLSCGPEVAVSSKPSSRSATGDIMDVSTWDNNTQKTESLSPTPRVAKQDQFAIVVATFTGDASRSSAVASMKVLSQQYPTLGRGLTVRDRSRGTALSFGNYTGYQDPLAKKDMGVLKAMTTPQGKPLFGQVLLLKFKQPRNWNNLHPHDLWSVRKQYPKIVPIFTLEVAVWGDFESGQFPIDRRHATAEQYASALRAKGFEAYFLHNDSGELSSVTVGLFGPDAVDPETGFYAPEVDALLSRFPEYLVNGHSIRVFFDPNNHSLGSSVQQPQLAEVPVD